MKMKSYVPPENPTKPWPTEAPMERWFLYQRREPTGSKIASRRGSKPPVLLARGPLPCVEADAGSQDSWRTGEFSLAFLPYGKGAAMSVLIHYPHDPLRQHYDRLLEGGTAPNLARVTLARKIASISLAVWKKKEAYQPERDQRAEEIPREA